MSFYNAAKDLNLIRETRFKEEERGMYPVVHCKGVLHFHFPNVPLFEDMLAKICFICGDRLELALNAHPAKSKMENLGFGEKEGDQFYGISVLRMRRLLNFNGFNLTRKTRTGPEEVTFYAKRMPYYVWEDERRELWEYGENVVVEVPVDHPQFDPFWERWDMFSRYDYPVWRRYRARVNQIANHFKPWLWQPLWYCIICKRQHQGGHRLHVARKKGFPTIRYWMMRHFWDYPKQRSRHYHELKKTIKECREYEAENQIVRTEPFIKNGEVIG